MISKLSTYSHRPDAKRGVCILPLASVYWEDEMPDVREFVHCSERDREGLLQLFAIRKNLWDGKELSEEHQALWDTVRSRAPSWALFERLELSPDDQRVRKKTEEACAEDFAAFLAEADNVTMSEDDLGIQRFSATFNLEKETDPPKNERWWERVRRKLGMKSNHQTIA